MPDTIFLDRDEDGNFIFPDNISSRVSGNQSLVDLELAEFDNDTGVISYSFNTNNNLVIGARNLTQRIAKAILTIKGTNAWEPTVGSNFYNLFSTVDLSEIASIKSAFPMYLKTVEQDLIEQDIEAISGGANLPLGEQIDTLTMESVEYDVTFGGWLIAIRVRTRDLRLFVITI